jgi:hypothetical protein
MPDEPLTHSKEDASFKAIGSSLSTCTKTLVDATGQYRGRGPARLTFQANGDVCALSCYEQMKRFSIIDSREYSELLVVGIVVLSILALVAWEAVGMLDGL